MPRPRTRRMFGHAAAWRERRSRLVLALVAATLLASAFFAAAARFGERDGERPLEASGARPAGEAHVDAGICVDVDVGLVDALAASARLGCEASEPGSPGSGGGETASPAAPPHDQGPPAAGANGPAPAPSSQGETSAPSAGGGGSASPPSAEGGSAPPASSPEAEEEAPSSGANEDTPPAAGAADPTPPPSAPEGHAPQSSSADASDDQEGPPAAEEARPHPFAPEPPARPEDAHQSGENVGEAEPSQWDRFLEAARRAWDATAAPTAGPSTSTTDPARGEQTPRCTDPSVTCAGAERDARAWAWSARGADAGGGVGGIERGLLERLVDSVARYLRVG